MRTARRWSVGDLATAAAAGAAVLGAGAWLLARRRYDLRGRVVVITGGSRGLGLVLARRFVREGAKVALLARDPDALDRAAHELRALRAGAEALPVPCDVRRPRQVEDAIERVVATWGRLDVLVSCAGIVQVGPLEHMTLDDFQDALAVHVLGPLHLALAGLPHLRGRGEGRIVNIASIGGKVAVPHLLPYTASKFGLVGLSDGLRVELRRHGIKVTTVCPGLMRTGSPPNARFKGRHQAEHAWFAIGAALPFVSIGADRAAAQIVRACKRGASRLFITPQARAVSLVNELAPGLLTRALSLVNRLLPGPAADGSTESLAGWELPSAWAPSWLTALSDSASERNNELRAVR